MTAGAPVMNPARATKLFAGLLVFLAMPDLALAQDVSNAPTVSHPSSRTVSPRLSDLPDAHWHGSPMDLKVHPRPPLPPSRKGRLARALATWRCSRNPARPSLRDR